MVESVWRVVREGINRRLVLFAAEPSGDQFEVVLEFEVFGLFVNHFLEPFHTPDSHLNTDHHIQNHVPIVVPEENHISLGCRGLFVHVLYRLFLLSFRDLLLGSFVGLFELGVDG